jgi:hypothetical protein
MRSVFKYFSTIILLLLLWSGCDKQENLYPPDEDYIIFGHYYGMCFGEACREIFKIENQQLFEDTLDEYPGYNQPYHCFFIKQPEAKYQLVKNINKSFPVLLLNETAKVIGMPDAGDWGGLYVEIRQKGEIRYWYIDKMKSNLPAYLHSFVDTLNASIQKLQ